MMFRKTRWFVVPCKIPSGIIMTTPIPHATTMKPQMGSYGELELHEYRVNGAYYKLWTDLSIPEANGENSETKSDKCHDHVPP